MILGRGQQVTLRRITKYFLCTIEVNPGNDEMEIHEDITLRSRGEVEELNEVEAIEEGDEGLLN